MRLEIDDTYDKNFVYWLKYYMYDTVKRNLNYHKCENFNYEYNINAEDIILFSIKSIKISHIIDKYILFIDKNKFYKNMNIEKLVNLITYGSRTVKGYRIIPDIFSLVETNFDNIYREWQSNGN